MFTHISSIPELCMSLMLCKLELAAVVMFMHIVEFINAYKGWYQQPIDVRTVTELINSTTSQPFFFLLGLCVLDVLSKFGRLSGLSKKGCDWSILKSVPFVEISSNDLLGDNHQKAMWIRNMVSVWSYYIVMWLCTCVTIHSLWEERKHSKVL